VSGTRENPFALRGRFPVESLVRCRCSRCGLEGKLWRIHSYDVENRDLRMYAAAAGRFTCSPWPLAAGIDATWIRPSDRYDLPVQVSVERVA